MKLWGPEETRIEPPLTTAKANRLTLTTLGGMVAFAIFIVVLMAIADISEQAYLKGYRDGYNRVPLAQAGP